MLGQFRAATDRLLRAPDPAALADFMMASDLDSGHPEIKWVRAWALRALIPLGGPRVRPVLLAASSESFWRLRMLAVRALALDPQATARLIALTRDPQWRVRDAACRSLGQGGVLTEAVVNALSTAPNDPDDRVAASAEAAHDRLRREMS